MDGLRLGKDYDLATQDALVLGLLNYIYVHLLHLFYLKGKAYIGLELQ
jgi:hypothetical protein